MATLDHAVSIDAPSERVWAPLATLGALFVRRKWDAGIKGFSAGLKRHAESAA